MSKAFYKPSVAPKLIAKFQSKSTNKCIEVWNTTCIVTNFGKKQGISTVLINPANANLSGVSNFPYFPRGGPIPKASPKSMHADWQPLGFVSSWGGMEVGKGMLYPSSVIDGLVHQLGGRMLALECKLINLLKGGCPVGEAVKTSFGGEKLKEHFDHVIHTTPPFYKYDGDPVISLKKCYIESLSKAFSLEASRIACPLIGAGARGFPCDIAISVAASETFKWMDTPSDKDKENDGIESVVAFGIPDKEVADFLVVELKSNQAKMEFADNE